MRCQELEIKEADKVAAKDEMDRTDSSGTVPVRSPAFMPVVCRLIEQREHISRKNDARWTETSNAGVTRDTGSKTALKLSEAAERVLAAAVGPAQVRAPK